MSFQQKLRLLKQSKTRPLIVSSIRVKDTTMLMTPNELFSLLSDETRLRCLLLLQKEGALCVCELSHILDSIQPKISRHLALMRRSGLVLDERKGQWVYYSLNESLPHWTKSIIATTLENLMKEEPYKSDIKKMGALKKKNICN